MDFVLGDRPLSGVMPETDKFGSASGVKEDPRIHQVVVEYKIGSGKALDAVQGNQSWVTRPRPNEVDSTDSLAVFPGHHSGVSR